MKKLTLIGLSLILILVFSGCGRSSKPGQGQTKDTVAEAKKVEEERIASEKAKADEERLAVEKKAKAEEAKIVAEKAAEEARISAAKAAEEAKLAAVDKAAAEEMARLAEEARLLAEKLAMEDAARLAEDARIASQKYIDAGAVLAIEGEYLGDFYFFESESISSDRVEFLSRLQALEAENAKLVAEYRDIEKQKIEQGYYTNSEAKANYVQELAQIAQQRLILDSALKDLDNNFRALPEKLIGHEIVTVRLQQMDDDITRMTSKKEKMDADILEIEGIRAQGKDYASSRLHNLKSRTETLGSQIEHAKKVKKMLTEGQLTARISAEIEEATEEKILQLGKRVDELNHSIQVSDSIEKELQPLCDRQANLGVKIEATYREREGMGSLKHQAINLRIVTDAAQHGFVASLKNIDEVPMKVTVETQNVVFNSSTGVLKIVFPLGENRSFQLKIKENPYHTSEWSGDVDQESQSGVFYAQKVKNALQIEREIREAQKN